MNKEEQVLKKSISAFKDGIADALLEGYMSDYHPEMHYYKQGYDFGMTMYSAQLKMHFLKKRHYNQAYSAQLKIEDTIKEANNE